MTATDELRAMLDERGVEWEGKDGQVRWEQDGFAVIAAHAWPRNVESGHLVVHLCYPTPTQAIEATVGRTCRFTLEPDRDEVERRRKLYEENPGGLFPCDMPQAAWTCSECGAQYRVRRDGNGHAMFYDWINHCPNCGAKVIK